MTSTREPGCQLSSSNLLFISCTQHTHLRSQHSRIISVVYSVVYDSWLSSSVVYWSLWTWVAPTPCLSGIASRASSLQPASLHHHMGTLHDDMQTWPRPPAVVQGGFGLPWRLQCCLWIWTVNQSQVKSATGCCSGQWKWIFIPRTSVLFCRFYLSLCFYLNNAKDAVEVHCVLNTTSQECTKRIPAFPNFDWYWIHLVLM